MRNEDDILTFYYCGQKESPVYNIVKESILKEEHKLIDFYNEFLIDVYLLLDKPTSNYVAIDWDNTISADKDYFLALIKLLKSEGYIPFVCTLRAPDKENIKEIRDVLEECNIAIYLTNGKPKRKYMKKLGIKVHLWIDDYYPGISGESCKIFSRNNIQ